MIISNNDIIGVNIYAPAKRKPLEKASGVVVDPVKRTVAAITVKSGTGQRAIPMQEIKQIKKDRIVVRRSETVKNALPAAQQNLQQKTVISNEGVKLGTVSNIYFDSASGELNEIEVKRRGERTTIGADAIVQIGQDIAVVDTAKLSPEMTQASRPQRITEVSRELTAYLRSLESETTKRMGELRRELEQLPYDRNRILQIRAIRDKASHYIEVMTRELMQFNLIARSRISSLTAQEDNEFAVHTVRTEAMRARERVMESIERFESVMTEKANEPF